MKLTSIVLLSVNFVYCLCAPTSHNEESDSPAPEKLKTFWYERNARLLNEKLRSMNIEPERLPKVKNVILFIGDGMGSTTLTATRVFKNQRLSAANLFEHRLIFDDFPASAFVRTDTLNSLIPESAAAATALFCGVKTNTEFVGLDATADPLLSCASKRAETPSIVEWAQRKNLKTGFVTTSRVTHATPAALYAHSRRHMEDDSKREDGASLCDDIAKQLIESETGRRMNVVLGGGLRGFLPKRLNETHRRGRRIDERNLTDEWISQHDDGDFVTNKKELEETTANHVLGLFSLSHLRFRFDQNGDVQPSLSEMTTKAIKLLRMNNENGFLLVVESAKIDLAHHLNNAFRALDETLELERAVESAMGLVDMSETLIIVTSDHASAITYSGFNTPQNYSVLGMDKFLSDVDKKTYQLLMYASGPGNENYNETLARSDPQNAYHKATIPLIWGNHDATDVPLFAQGPLANILFSGSIDQTYVAHAIAFAMCLDQFESRCSERFATDPPHRYSKIHELKQQLNRVFHRSNFVYEEQNQTITTESVSLSSSTTEEEVDSTTDNPEYDIDDDYYEPSTENDLKSPELSSTTKSILSSSSSSTPKTVSTTTLKDDTDSITSVDFYPKVYLSDAESPLAISNYQPKSHRMYYLLIVLCSFVFTLVR